MFNTESSSEETKKLSVKKCCHLDEAYDVETKNCFKIQNENVVFEPYDYFTDVLSMVDVAYDYENIEFPSEYNISDIGKPYCNPKDSEEQLLFNIPVDPDVELHGDLESNDAFRIEFPSHELFEISQYKFHQDYCIDLGYRYGQFWSIVAIFCKESLRVTCQRKNCIRFCCPPTYISTLNKELRNDNPIKTGPEGCKPIDANDLDKLNPTLEDNENLWRIYGIPECFKLEDQGFVSYLLKEGESVKNKNGEIRIGTGYFDHENSCVVRTEIVNKEENETSYSTQINVCKPDNIYEQGYLSWVRIIDFQIIPAILVISTILLGVLLIYEWINNRDKLFCCLRICVILMNFIFNTVLCIVKLQDKVERNHPKICVTEAIVIQFCYLSTICWLNTMCFHVWKKFRSLKIDDELRATDLHLRSPKVGFRNPKFKWYILYATGVPFIVSGITLIIHCLPENMTRQIILPFEGITKEQLETNGEENNANVINNTKLRCFFDDNLSTLLYFFVITGPILLLNLSLFILFAKNLCHGVWLQEQRYSRMNGQSQNFKRLVIMFIALGIPWLCDLFGFIMTWLFDPKIIFIYVIKTIFNVITSSQGIIMFCAIFLFSNSSSKFCSSHNTNDNEESNDCIEMNAPT